MQKDRPNYWIANSEEYPPSEDTYFLLDNIPLDSNMRSALDVGSGSGYVTKFLSDHFEFVVGTEVNFGVLRSQTYKTNNIICCNAADPLNYKFDLVVCNLPYLATEEIIDISTDGGYQGLDIPMKIIRSIAKCVCKGGKFLFVTSSLSNYKELVGYVESFNFKAGILAKKKLFFEELVLVQAVKT